MQNQLAAAPRFVLKKERLINLSTPTQGNKAGGRTIYTIMTTGY